MNYWIIQDNAQRGPMSLEELASTPGIDLSTPVWRDDLPDWTTAGALPEVAAAIAQFHATSGIPHQQPYAPQQSYASQQPQQYAYTQGGNQAGHPQDYMPPMPSTHLAWAILSTICCCLPLGVVAIIYASKVSPAYDRGDYEAALKASKRAELWIILAFTLGIVLIPFQIILQMLMAQQ